MFLLGFSYYSFMFLRVYGRFLRYLNKGKEVKKNNILNIACRIMKMETDIQYGFFCIIYIDNR